MIQRSVSLSWMPLLVLLVVLVCPVLLVSADSCGSDCGDYDCGGGYYCSCDYNYYNGNYASCSSKAGEIAGIVIGCVVFVGILICIAVACRRRRYYAGAGYGGAAYGGSTVVTSQQYNGNAAPMQAIPVQYAQGAQPYGGPVYAQQPMGGGQYPAGYPATAPPPSYTETPYAQPTMSEPYKPQYGSGTAI